MSSLVAQAELLKARLSEETPNEKDKKELIKLLESCLLLAGGRPASPLSGRSGSFDIAQGRLQRFMPNNNKTEDINVLIVDDDPVAATILSRQLERLNIKNEYVLSGIEALEKLYDYPERYHVVLCDVNMPGLDGGQVLQHVLENEHLRYIPIVMVSSDSDLNKAKELVSAGAKDYIVKPIKQIALVSLSHKVNAWRQGNSTQHLSALYDITAGLLLHLKVILKRKEDSKALPSGIEEETGTTEENQSKTKTRTSSVDENVESGYEVRSAIIQAASLPMRRLFGTSNADITKGDVDVMQYVLVEDQPILQYQLREALFRETDDHRTKKKLVFRWIDFNGNAVPVVGSWTRIGGASNCEVIMESSSLLPSLMLKREQGKRKQAELKAKQALTENMKLSKDLEKSKTNDKYMRSELNSMMCEMSEFSKMLTENPSVLTWRINVLDGKIEFVSPKSLNVVLGYYPEQVIGKNNKDFLHKEDWGKIENELSNMNRSVRLRRINKDGKIVWVESRAYAWWDKNMEIVIVTEHDISNLLMPDQLLN